MVEPCRGVPCGSEEPGLVARAFLVGIRARGAVLLQQLQVVELAVRVEDLG